MKNTIPALQLTSSSGTVLSSSTHPLHWYRLDDGVMGGQSSTNMADHNATEITGENKKVLRFAGQINTNGGGFCSIRAALPDDTGLCFANSTTTNEEHEQVEVTGIKIRYRGDGKTYKVILSDGQRSTGGPFSRSPTWQMDLPTVDRTDDATDTTCTAMDEVILPLNRFQPSFGPRSVSEEEKAKLVLIASEQRMIGLMLSLKLSDGSSNPKETFGEGIFDFCLDVEAIEVV